MHPLALNRLWVLVGWWDLEYEDYNITDRIHDICVKDNDQGMYPFGIQGFD
jgi:hypothetical protein